VSEPSASGRLHPSSVVFRLLPHVRALIVPGLVVLLVTREETWQIWLMLMFVPSTLYEVGQYLTLRYRLEGGELVVRSGMIWKRERHIPAERIHGIDLTQGPLHRMLGVAEVRIETAGGTEPEAVLRVLSLDALSGLRLSLAGARGEGGGARSAEGGGAGVEGGLRGTEGEELLRLGPAELVKLGLVSMRGAAAALIVVGLASELDLLDRLDISDSVRALSASGVGWGSVLVTGLALVGLPVALVLVSIAWTLLRLYDFRLIERGDDLRLSCGLLTRVHATIPRRRIQVVSVITSPVHRLFDRVSIRVETAGGSIEHESRNVIGQKWFVPLLPAGEAGAMLRRVTGGRVDLAGLEWRPISARAFRRRAKLATLWALVLSAVVLAMWRPWGAASAAIFAPLLLWHARLDVRRTGFAVCGWGIAFRSGVLTRRVTATFFDRVQVVSLDESPFDRRAEMATVDVDTAGAGATGHRVRVPYLDRQIARALYERLVGESMRATRTEAERLSDARASPSA